MEQIIYGLKKGAEEFPLMVVLAVTYLCNARCPSCPYTNSAIRESYKDRKFMSWDTFRIIANECGKFNSYIRITGGGEPLLHPMIVDMVEYAKNEGAGIGIITNGSLLNTDKVVKLLYHGVDAIELSVDAADKDTYSKVRIGLDFDRLVQNAKYLRKKRDAMKSNTKIIASIINQKALDGKLEDAVAFWKDIVDDVQVRKYLTWGINDPAKSADETPYISDQHTPCPFPFERLNIDSRGKIEFCGYDIVGETDFGNVNVVSIQSAWKGEKFSHWRDLLLNGKYEDIPICKKCPDWKYRSWEYNYWNVLKKAEKARRK